MQTLCKRYANAMVGDGVEAEAEAHALLLPRSMPIAPAEDNKARANDDGT